MTYHHERNRRVAEQYRRGVPIAMGVTAFVAGVGHFTTPREAVALEIGLGALAVLAATYFLFRVPFFVRRPSLLTKIAGVYFALAIAHTAAHTGGFETVVGALVLVSISYGATVAPLSPRDFATDSLLVVPASVAMIALHSPDPGSPLLYLIVILSAVVLLTAGSVLRDRITRRSYELDRRLAETHSELEENQLALAALNAELEAQVRQQVDELLSRAGDIESLNAQLRRRVRQRSHDLVLALQRVATDDLDS